MLCGKATLPTVPCSSDETVLCLRPSWDELGQGENQWLEPETSMDAAPGNVTSKTDCNGDAITYTYDQLNRLTQKTYPDSTTVNYRSVFSG